MHFTKRGKSGGGHALFKIYIVAFLYRIDHFNLFDVRANKLKLVLLHLIQNSSFDILSALAS